MESALSFSAITSNEKIDVENGIIYGASIITEGQAKGANSEMRIDRVTLSQIHKIFTDSPEGIKVKLSQLKEHQGSAGQIVGTVKNSRFDGPRLRGDIHLLKEDSNFKKIIEMAQKMASQFGLSIVSPKDGFTLEKVDGNQCLRCSTLDSVDFVEAPAANNGLFFSAKTEPTNKNMSTIKFAKGESGDHASDCECKTCMSASSKKEMSAFVAGLLGLSALASETEISAAFKAVKGGDSGVAELSRKLDETKAELSRIQASSENSLALSKKGEIEALLSEASRAGKVVPFDNDDLFAEKDGKVTIKMEPVALSKVIAKLSTGAVKTSHTVTLTAKTPEGKSVDRRTPEGRAQFSALLAAKREESANRYLATRN